MLQLTLSLLKSCKTHIHLKQIQACATKSGLDNDPVVVGKLLLLSAVSVPGIVDYACRIFSFVPFPDTFMWNALIRGLSDSLNPDQSLLAYARMRRTSVPPDSFTFAFALKGAANYRSLRAGSQIHSDVVCHGLDGHLFVGTTLVSLYAECGCLSDAQRVFEDMTQPNIVAWNAFLTAFLRANDLNGAERLFAQMPWRNQTSWNVMLAGYAKAGNMGLARSVFLEMQHKDPVSWSTMITGFSACGCFDDTFRFFRELLRSELSPNEVSLTGVLSACAQAGAFEFGKILHGYVEKTGSIQIVSVTNALLDTYAKCGNIDMTWQVFNSMMEAKCVVSWTSMIAALAMHGLGEEAIELFHEMEEHGIKPDGVTFISLLYACSHAGLIDEGYDYFCKMEKNYGIERSAEHYGCMVDLYGRAGHLDKSYELIKQMPIKPNAIIWRTLLGACSIHGQVKLAEHVKKQLSELDPFDSSDYVLLSNVYSIAGKWNDAANVRISMTKQKMQKTPGWSTIEIDKEIYLFIANDEPKGPKEEAHRKLKEIMWRLREEGYAPETVSVLHDIEEEEKQDAISRHSEKLAVAFGIAKTSYNSVIRIVKNLRVCRDCHVMMKLISKVYQREIIVRDRSRFHSFREGSCSCKDYW